MLLRNTSARLITIHGETLKQYAADEKTILGVQPGPIYNLKPAGAAVEVPQALIDADPVLQHLIKSKELVEETSQAGKETAVTEPDNGLDELSKEDLYAYAESLGVTGIDKRTSKENLVKAIDKHDSGAAE